MKQVCSLVAGLLASAGLLAQCDEAIDLTDTIWHCQNGPVFLSPLDSTCLSAFSGEFDGGNDRVTWNTDAPHLLSDATDGFTFALWIAMDANPSNEVQFIWEEGNSEIGWNAYLDVDTLRVGFWDADTAIWLGQSWSPSPSAWTHLAVVADPLDSSWNLWMDGVEVASTAGWLGLPVHEGDAAMGAAMSTRLMNGNPVNAGGGGGGIPFEWTGWMDEAARWSVALDSAAIVTAMDCPLEVVEGLEAAWMFEPGDEAYDFSENGWTGNMQGSSLVNFTPDAWPASYVWSDGTTAPGLEFDLGGPGNNSQWVFVEVLFDDGSFCVDSTFIADWNPNVVADVVSPSCFGESDGSIFAVLDGGTAPYTVSVSGGANPMALSAGNYNVTVVDAMGCADQSNVSVSEPSGIDWLYTTSPDDCTELETGVLSVDSLWSPNGGATLLDTLLDFNALAAGGYELSATDSSGCVQTLSFTIDVDYSTCLPCVEVDIVPDTVWDCFQGPVFVGSEAEDCPNYMALELDGSNDRVELGFGGFGQPSNPAYEDSVLTLSLSIEFNAVNLNGTQMLYKEGDGDAGFAVYLDGDSLRAGWWDAATQTEGVWAAVGGVEADVWQRAGWICDAPNGTMTLLLGGSVPTTVTFEDTLGMHPGGAVIGATGTIRLHDGLSFAGGGGPGGGWNHEFEGLMDRFAIWDFAMSVEEWESTSSCPSSFFSESLFAFHSFESDAGDVSVDEGYIAENGEYGSGANNTSRGDATVNTYLWSDGDTTPFNYLFGNDTTTHTVYFSSSATGSCMDTVVVVNWNPQAFVVSTVDPSCGGIADGSVVLALNGGSQPYTRNINGGANPDSLTAGNYNAIVQDAAGCSDFTSFTLNVEAAWDVFVVTDTITCSQSPWASAEAMVEGANGPWVFGWDADQPTELTIADSLVAGWHTLYVEDNLGCNETIEVFIESDVLSIQVTTTDASCSGVGGGTASVTTTGGVAPFNLDWGGVDPSSMPAGFFEVIVTDATGCTESVMAEVVTGNSAGVSVSTVEATCATFDDGAIQIDPYSPDAEPITVTWNGDAFDPANVLPGTYELQISDAFGCTLDTSITVGGPAPINVGIITGEVIVELGSPTPYTYDVLSDPNNLVIWEVSMGGTLVSANSAGTNVVWNDLTDAFLCVYEMDPSGCTSELSCIEGPFEELVGIATHAGQDFSIYPNPTTGMVSIEGGQFPLAILDPSGRILSVLSQGDLQFGSLDVSGWAKGMYWLRDAHGAVKTLIVE